MSLFNSWRLIFLFTGSLWNQIKESPIVSITFSLVKLLIQVMYANEALFQEKCVISTAEEIPPWNSQMWSSTWSWPSFVFKLFFYCQYFHPGNAWKLYLYNNITDKISTLEKNFLYKSWLSWSNWSIRRVSWWYLFGSRYHTIYLK